MQCQWFTLKPCFDTTAPSVYCNISCIGKRYTIASTLLLLMEDLNSFTDVNKCKLSFDTNGNSCKRVVKTIGKASFLEHIKIPMFDYSLGQDRIKSAQL